MADKPAEVPCTTCGEPAKDRGIYAFAAKVVAGRGEKQKFEGSVTQDTGPAVINEHGSHAHDIRSVDVECTVCAHKDYRVYDANVEGIGACTKMPPDTGDVLDLLPCGGALRVLIASFGTEAPGTYPRYDKGLGLVLTSAEHRRRVCKERGLIPVDGDYDEDRIMSKIENERAEEDAVANDYYAKLADAPEYADFRRLQDAGFYDAVTKKAPPPPIEVPTRKKNRLKVART